MTGRHRKFQETKVLDLATEVFWTKGYGSATTQDLLQAMKMNKGSLYNAFGNKKTLFQKVVSHHSNSVFNKLKGQIENSNEPLEVIRELFWEACDPKDPSQHLKGCFLGNAISELANIDIELERLAIKKLKALEKIFRKALDKAEDLDQLGSVTDTETTARYLINLWNGINITRRMYPHTSELEPLLKMSLSVLPKVRNKTN